MSRWRRQLKKRQRLLGSRKPLDRLSAADRAFARDLGRVVAENEADLLRAIDRVGPLFPALTGPIDFQRVRLFDPEQAMASIISRAGDCNSLRALVKHLDNVSDASPYPKFFIAFNKKRRGK